jgi:YesN/AraC family two-component response regulator
MYSVVLVEDQEFVRNAVADMIGAQCRDFRVVGAYSNGQDALDAVAALVPDIVVTDIKMRGMDGLQLAKLLHQRFPRVQVVVLSGFGEFDFARKAMSYGVSEYLLKPCRPEDLLKALSASALRIEEYRSLSRLAVSRPEAGAEAEAESGADADAETVLGNALAYIRESYWTDLGLEGVARHCFVSGRHLSRLFSERLGVSFTTLLTDTRIGRAKELLRDPAQRVQNVAGLVGYDNYRYFNHVFKKVTGMTPTAYRRSLPDRDRDDPPIRPDDGPMAS